jgi:hypothetical protein
VGLFQHVVREIRDRHLANATVVGDKFGAGALVGLLERGGITRCSAASVNVSGNSSVGGLVGETDGILAKCWTTGSVTGARYVGGLVGRIGEGAVNGSYSEADVFGGNTCGGLIGLTSQPEAQVDSCYARGDVTGTHYLGGLVGDLAQGSLYKCYSVGRVTGDNLMGGLVGNTRGNNQTTLVLGCLWDREASGQSESPAGRGYSTTEMKLIDAYLTANWDFATTWALCDGLNYPILLWQIPIGDLACPDGVTFSDFAWFAQNWRRRDCIAVNAYCEGADLDDSGVVDFRDLLLLAENWLAGTR